jgi:DNA-binding response OmpR family regulator
VSATDENGRPLVLLADDDEDILALVAFRLRRADYEVLTAADGEEALRLAFDRSPDLAVLDVKMPKLDGLDVVRRIRDNEATTHMPVILLSAHVQEADSARGFEAGADHYLKKPFSPQELLAQVQAVLAHR